MQEGVVWGVTGQSRAYGGSWNAVDRGEPRGVCCGACGLFCGEVGETRRREEAESVGQAERRVGRGDLGFWDAGAATRGTLPGPDGGARH